MRRSCSLSGLFRVILWVPTMLYGFTAVSHTQDFRHLPQLRHAPYNKLIVPGEMLSAAGGMGGFVWNALICAVPVLCTEGSLLFVGIMDSIFTSVVLIASILQSRYLPLKQGCQAADTWQVPEGTPSLFGLGLLPNATIVDVRANCSGYVSQFRWGIAVFILYFLTAFFALYSTVKTSTTTAATTTVRNKIFNPISNTFGFVFDRVFPARYREKLRFYSRYLSKYYSHKFPRLPVRGPIRRSKPTASTAGKPKPSSSVIELDSLLKDHVTVSVNPVDIERSTSRLSMVPQEILLSICDELHYIDIVQLARTSKRMRGRLFGTTGVQANDWCIKRMETHGCVGADGRRCFACDIQVCLTCHHTAPIFDLETSHHAQFCRPVCRSCFESECCPSNALKDRRHTHHNPRAERHRRIRKKKFYDGRSVKPCTYFELLAYYQGMGDSESVMMGDWQSLCRVCMYRTKGEAMDMKARREEKQMQDMVNQDLECSICTVPIVQSGPLWWRCSSCHTECKASYHPSWREN